MSTLKQTEKVRPLSDVEFMLIQSIVLAAMRLMKIFFLIMRIVPTMKIRSGNIPLKNFCLASTTRALIVWTIGFV